MSEMSDLVEDEVVKHYFRTGNATVVSVMAIVLLSTAADDDDTGVFTSSTGVEITDAGAYARIDRPPLDANWTATAGGDGQTDNAAAITYVQATANWAPGDVAAIAMCDNAGHNLGLMYFHTVVDTAKAIDQDDTAEFGVGAITVSFD